jgi:iodotyrosine deiodinase
VSKQDRAPLPTVSTTDRAPLRTIPYSPARVPAEECVERMRAQLAVASARRTVRQFSSMRVPREAIEDAIRIAGTAPSGAHKQPWYFVAIADAHIKERVREAAELEERAFYEERATPEWLDALAPLGTDFRKEHLSTAPWLIIVFRRDQESRADGSVAKTYYAQESVGIAVGFLIAALHQAGLATLTHTPAPMTFLRELCGRPKSEKPFVILPVGYPADDCVVPDLERKPLTEISEFR